MLMRDVDIERILLGKSKYQKRRVERERYDRVFVSGFRRSVVVVFR